jgi:(E)-4-hydroxy-3-methylbut-2-enyl-diphosphate synthase
MNLSPLSQYCKSPFSYHRRTTHEVKVGDVGIGGNNPIRVQSMTIADTMDTAATVKEVVALVEAGCEIVRITAPSLHEAENLKNIKAELKRQNIRVPLVADIHFTPNAALIAAEVVEKVRINPGNYADKKKFAIWEYTDEEYQGELERVAERFLPLVKKCKTNGEAMRIGVKHGSHSDRIMNRFGDTPAGMVESALEFVRICEAYGYRDLVISMKSSNPQVMIQAYRLLAARMNELGMTYPFHLGVTEAGDGEDGRIKSAVGIGSLLEDGIGDTIRVSLTEDSVYEIPVAYALVQKFNAQWEKSAVAPPSLPLPISETDYWQKMNPYAYHRRETLRVNLAGSSFGSKELVRGGLSMHGNGTTEEEWRTAGIAKKNLSLRFLASRRKLMTRPKSNFWKLQTTTASLQNSDKVCRSC